MLSVSADNRAYISSPKCKSYITSLCYCRDSNPTAPRPASTLPRFQQICGPHDQKLSTHSYQDESWVWNLVGADHPLISTPSPAFACYRFFLLSLFVRGSFHSPTWIHEEYITLEFGTGLCSATIMCTSNSTSKGAHWRWQFIHFPWSEITSSKPPGKKISHNVSRHIPTPACHILTFFMPAHILSKYFKSLKASQASALHLAQQMWCQVVGFDRRCG